MFTLRVLNTPENAELIKTFLRIVAELFNDEHTELDLKMFNASRITRVAGTVARKGDDDGNRKHRMASIVRPHGLDTLDLETLQEFVAKYKTDTPVKANGQKLTTYPIDEGKYRHLNDQAKLRINHWVPHLLGQFFHEYGDGYEAKQDALGRDLEERISILGDGRIMDFGESDQDGEQHDGHRTPVALIATMLEISKTEAAQRLSNTLGMPWSEFSSLAERPAASGTMHAMPGALLGEADDVLAEPVCYNSIRHTPIKPVRYLIDKLLAFDTHTVFSGPAKMGKTTLTYDVVLHVLFGRPFLGRHVVRKVRCCISP